MPGGVGGGSREASPYPDHVRKHVVNDKQLREARRAGSTEPRLPALRALFANLNAKPRRHGRGY